MEDRYNISRISDTYKKSFICILLKYRYIPHNNNLLLIPDLFVRSMMTCIWRHYWLHDVLWRLNKQKGFLPYGVINREACVGSLFSITLWTLLRLVKLIIRFEHHFCSRTKVRMGGRQKAVFEGRKSLSDRVKGYYQSITRFFLHMFRRSLCNFHSIISTAKKSLREKCPNTEFLLVRIFPYSVQMRENRDQKNSVFRQFSRSGYYYWKKMVLESYIILSVRGSATFWRRPFSIMFCRSYLYLADS